MTTQRPPTTVLAYAALVVASLVIAVVEDPRFAGVYVTAAVWTLLLVGLWRGRRIAWVLVLLLEAVFLIAAPFVEARWWEVLMGVAGVALLLSPSTRRHTSQHR